MLHHVCFCVLHSRFLPVGAVQTLAYRLFLQLCFCVYCSNNTVLIFAFGRSTDAGACILSLKQPASIGRGFLKNTP